MSKKYRVKCERCRNMYRSKKKIQLGICHECRKRVEQKSPDSSPDIKKEQELNLRLNKNLGMWDYDLLANFDEDILLDVGFEQDELNRIFDLDEEEDGFDSDEALAGIDKAESKRGEVYTLGVHKLMCGDAANPKDLAKLMGDARADMVFTDPPYNVDYTGKTKDKLKLKNDKQQDEQFYAFLKASFENLAKGIKKGASVYVCHADSSGHLFRQAFVDSGFDLKQVIIWNKDQFVMGRQDYQWKHEPILYGYLKGAAHEWHGGRDKTTVWDIPRPRQSKVHPTMKPIKLVMQALENSSKHGDLILDTFGGSGSTLIAAEKAGRSCFMMELDPKYCDVIKQRYAKLKE